MILVEASLLMPTTNPDAPRQEAAREWLRATLAGVAAAENRLRVKPVGLQRAALTHLAPVIERLAELMTLIEGWNSYDAQPVSETALRTTLRLLLEYVRVGVACPTVVPTVRGGLQLEWHRNGVDIEIETTPDGRTSCLLENPATQECIEIDLSGEAGEKKLLSQWLKLASTEPSRDHS